MNLKNCSKLLSHIFVIYLLNSKIPSLNAQYSHFNKIVKLINSHDKANDSKIDLNLFELKIDDEIGTIYNFALAFKLYKIDSNFKEAYIKIKLCDSLYNIESIKKQKQIYKKVFTDQLNPILLMKNIERDAFILARKENSMTSYRNYLHIFSNDENEHIVDCEKAIDSLLFIVAKNQNTLYSYREYLKKSIYKIFKANAIESIKSIENNIAINLFKENSSSKVKLCLDSFDVKSLWHDSLINFYYLCRWNEVSLNPNINALTFLIDEIDKDKNNSAINKGSISIRQKCIINRDILFWNISKNENTSLSYLNYLSNPLTSIYKDTAIAKITSFSLTDGNTELIEEILPFCSEHQKSFLSLMHDSLVINSFFSSSNIKDYSNSPLEILSQLKTIQYQTKLKNIYVRNVIQDLESNFSYANFYQLITSFNDVLDSSNNYHLRKMFDLCYPYDSAIHMDYEFPKYLTKDELNCPIGYNFSPARFSEGSSCGGYYTRTVGNHGFILTNENGDNYGVYEGIKFKEDLGHNFLIFTNLNNTNYYGDPIGDDFILFFDPLSSMPLKFVSSISFEEYESIEIFSLPSLKRSTKQTLIKVNDRSSSDNRSFGVLTIDQQHIILQPNYTDLSLIELSYKGNRETMIKLNDNNLVGLSTIDGNIILNPVFENLALEDYSFSKNGHQIINYQGKYGIMNKDFEVVLNAIYDEIKLIKNSEIYAIKEGIRNSYNYVWRIYNVNNNNFHNVSYSEFDLVGDNFLVSLPSIKNQQFFIDKDFKLIYTIPNNIKIRDCRVGQNDMITIRGWINEKNTWGLINLKMKKVVIFSSLHPWASLSVFYNDRILFKDINGKYGYLDKNGVVVVKPIYDDANDFYSEYAYVKLYGESFKINKYGKKVD